MDSYPIATVACFDPTRGELPRRTLDGARLRQFLQKLRDAGTRSVLIASSTGHGHLRTAGELEEFFREAAAAKLDDLCMMALLRPEDGVDANAGLLRLLKALNYDVVFLRPGTNLKPDDETEAVVENLRLLVRHAAGLGLPVGLYSIPDVSGLPLTADAAAMLVKSEGGESIVAVKVTEADYAKSTKTFLDHPDLKHLTIVQGWDPHLARALQDGGSRCGVTSGPMSLAVHQYLHILDAAGRGDWDEVKAAELAVTQVFESMQDDPTKFADLQRAKYIMGLGHPICGEVAESQVDRVFDALENLSRQGDRERLCRSLDLMQDGPFHDRLTRLM